MPESATAEAPETAPAAPPPEAPPEAPEGAAPEGEAPAADPLESKLASYATRERGLQRELMKFQNRSKKVEADLAAATKWREDMEAMVPMERAKHVGVDYGKLTADLLKSGEAPETEEQAQARADREWIENQQKAQEEARGKADEEAQTAAEKARVDQVNTYLAGRDDTPVAAALGLGAMVIAEMRDWAEKNEQAPDADMQAEIAQKVEQRTQLSVLGQLKAIAERSDSDAFAQQIRDLFTAEAVTPPSDEQAEPGRKKAPRNAADGPSTLTNSMGKDAGGRKAPERTSRADKRAQLMKRLRENGHV